VADIKTVLLITDEADSTQTAARVIAAAVDALDGYQAITLCANFFSGTDLLPASVFFVGCEKPHPLSFAYLEDLFLHINLAGRSCGVFSPDRKALQYLSALVNDCEARKGKPLFLKNGAIDSAALGKWIQNILGQEAIQWTH
jgi:hypothetical protein